MTTAYSEFVAGKTPAVLPVGIESVTASDIPPPAFRWQAELTAWALRMGRAALFEDCGLGKTLQELHWSQRIVEHTGRDVLILAPLAVAGQTLREGQRFGVEVRYCKDQGEVQPGITVTNYDRLANFDAGKFAGVVLDESSILKAFSGKTKNALVDTFAGTPFKLCATATPAPNDVMELGNHSEFLGVMDSHEMLTRWFINDTMAAGSYRLKGHAEEDFWLWVASWAACVAKPSDVLSPDGIPFSNEGYELPGLDIEEHVVNAGGIAKPGELFHDGKLTATTIHQEMRQTASERARLAATLVNAEPDEPFTVWCNANYEADELKTLLPEAVEVRGEQSREVKEQRLLAFADRKYRVLITKPSLAGFGLNYQHCARSAFVGLSYSFEQFYQALRRSYRFGQKRKVRADVIVAKSETGVRAVVERKRLDHQRMQARMARAMREVRQAALHKDRYAPTLSMRVPSWLSPQEVA